MFKDRFKYYKSKNPAPSFRKVLDFNSPESIRDKVRKIELSSPENVVPFFGFKPVDSWELYELIDRPGLLFIKNPFTTLGQRYWTVRSLKDYPKKPNKSNLDAQNLVPDNKNWWDMCQSSNVLLMHKLRWVTLGFHHNWDSKVYSDSNRGKFPKDLRDMTGFLAQTLGYENFSAEAAIVNYYRMESTLSGHTDHSERNLSAPLFSFSFGQTAVFLIGGKSLDDIATPIFLRSGDIVIMSRESRLCYHGVPKILQVDSRLWRTLERDSDKQCPKEYKDVVALCKNEESWAPFGAYLGHSRINLNVRQVLFEGEKQLD